MISFVYRVDALGEATAEGQGQPGDDGVVVLVEAGQERFEFDEPGLTDLFDPGGDVGAASFGHQLRKLAHHVGERGHFGAGGQQFVEVSAVSGAAEQIRRPRRSG
ncbi:hypothetical protein [Nocardia sp. CA-135398]|uniref:hypothetical protein n=1 Tax=Nocardia sp. CA-135398 TaxID=3239977 RepID=UPI003D96763E